MSFWRVVFVFVNLQACVRAKKCKFALAPLTELSQCPTPHASDAGESGTSGLPSCNDESLSVGALCEADGECGTNGSLDNCPDVSGGQGAWDVYIVRSICPSFYLTPITDLSRCPTPHASDAGESGTSGLPSCTDEGLSMGVLCEADGECGTDGSLDNCPDVAGGPGAWDVYIVGSMCPTLIPLTDASSCPAAHDSDAGHQATSGLPDCADASLPAGTLCEADGECHTDKSLDNCPDVNGGPGAWDVYVVGEAEVTCGEIKKAYKASGCCGMPDALFKMDQDRRLTSISDAQDLSVSVKNALEVVSKSRGRGSARQLAQRIQQVLSEFS